MYFYLILCPLSRVKFCRICAGNYLWPVQGLGWSEVKEYCSKAFVLQSLHTYTCELMQWVASPELRQTCCQTYPDHEISTQFAAYFPVSLYSGRVRRSTGFWLSLAMTKEFPAKGLFAFASLWLYCRVITGFSLSSCYFEAWVERQKADPVANADYLSVRDG